MFVLLLLFEPIVVPFKVNVLFPSLKELRRPPVRPTGAISIDMSTHDVDSDVDPVQIHLPSTHIPFLLQ